MAELDYGRAAGVEPGPMPGIGKVINFSGAILSLALIAGLATWAYQLMVRDVSGVPVIRALEGPMRIAPEDPGGQLDVHAGLAVNDVPANGIASEPAERLVLAGDDNLLADEDVTAGKLARMQPDVTPAETAPQVQTPIEEPSATAALAPEAEPAAPDSAEPDAPAMNDLIAAALTEATGQGADTIPSDLVPVDVGGVTRSLLPVPRPQDLAVIAPPPVAADGFVFKDPADIGEGTRLAQLGAYDSDAIARAEWARLSGLFPEFMTDKARVIEPAQSGGKQFFRLRAFGFQDLSDARRFCAALLAENANCIPVRQR